MSNASSAIQLACRLEVLPGSGVLERFQHAREFGFEGVSLPGRFLKDYLPDLRSCAPDLPLPIASLSLGFEGSLVSPRPEVRTRCQQSLLTLFDLCAELKIPSLNMPPVLFQDNPERLSEKEEQDALLLEQLPTLGDEAQQRGVLLLLEPVNRFESDYLNSVVHAGELCARLHHPAVGCTVDFYHMQLEELNPAEAIHQAGKWIRHVHVAENTRVQPGPGILDFVPGFRALREIGYTGWIEVECRSLSGVASEVLPDSVRYLREIWQVQESSLHPR